MQDIEFIYNFDQLKLNLGTFMCGNFNVGNLSEAYSLLNVGDLAGTYSLHTVGKSSR